MRASHFWRIGLVLVFSAGLLATGAVIASGQEQGVQRDGYTFADVNVSPGSACIGQSVTYSGTGAPANSQVMVILLSNLSILDASLVQVQASGSLLGTTTSDGSGNWSLTAAVPSTVELLGGSGGGAGTSTPLTPRTWDILAGSSSTPVPGLTLDNNLPDGLYLALGSLTVLDCAVAPAASIPSTGAPLGIMGIFGTAMIVPGCLILFRRQRPRPQR